MVFGVTTTYKFDIRNTKYYIEFGYYELYYPVGIKQALYEALHCPAYSACFEPMELPRVLCGPIDGLVYAIGGAAHQSVRILQSEASPWGQ